MNIKSLNYFIEVAKEKSFTNASKNLFVCQSALSKANFWKWVRYNFNW